MLMNCLLLITNLSPLNITWFKMSALRKIFPVSSSLVTSEVYAGGEDVEKDPRAETDMVLAAIW